MSYVYRELPPGDLHTDHGKKIWGVGYYNPQGDWQSETQYDTPREAAERVHWLNGGDDKAMTYANVRAMEQLASAISRMPHTVRIRP